MWDFLSSISPAGSQEKSLQTNEIVLAQAGSAELQCPGHRAMKSKGCQTPGIVKPGAHLGGIRVQIQLSAAEIAAPLSSDSTII